VDLAAEAKGTAVARVDWHHGRAVALSVTSPADDATVLAALAEADQAGIDCPLGWPDEFIRFVTAHQAGAVPLPPGGTPPGWRRALTLRVTDRVVHDQTGLTPARPAGRPRGHREGRRGLPGGVAEGLGPDPPGLQAPARAREAGPAHG
jgi:hypothetical protein